MPTPTKICKLCNTEKSREEFYQLKGKAYKEHWDCRSTICKVCQLIKSADAKRATKKAAIQYLGGKCVDCGLVSEHQCVYDFHHLNPVEKDLSFANTSLSFEKLKPELDKCVLLCANCHRLRHYTE